jgi:hypothetical protein
LAPSSSASGARGPRSPRGGLGRSGGGAGGKRGFGTPIRHHALAFRYGIDLGVFFRSYAARPLWLLGFPDQARTSIREALTLARTLAHPFSLAYALHWAATTHQLCREASATQEQAEVAIAFSREQGFAIWVPGGTILRGWP